MSTSPEPLAADVGERLRMALAEAGYPDVPVDVWDKACELVNLSEITRVVKAAI